MRGSGGASVNLGWMSDIGFVSEQGKVPEIVCAGALQLSETHVQAIVEATMAGQVETHPVFGLASSGLVKVNGFDNPYWFSDAHFGPLRAHDLQKHKASASQSRAAGTVDLGMALGAASSMYDAKAAVCSALTDSLVAVDIRALALKEAQSIIHVSDVLKNVPMIELAGTIAGKSKFLPGALREEGGH
ncbi:hypothetical protein DL770_005346 [Monosporascus sp. CRB-9-2]|nr:hypothetical protein DL770_005346 [Monosporascus sp. CRB-9-2]